MSRNKEKKKGGWGKSRGHENKSTQNSGNKSSTIPIEKLRFTIGDNQAENYARLIEYLAEQVLEEYGRKMEFILKNEKEYDLKEPKLESPQEKTLQTKKSPDKMKKTKWNSRNIWETRSA